MESLIDKVINIKNDYEDMLDSFEKSVGIHNILKLYDEMNLSFKEQSHGREWRKFREIYRYNFPPINKNIERLIDLFNTYYTAFISECLYSLKNIYMGKKVSNMKPEALHIQAWDVALCSINKKVSGGIDDYILNIEMQLYNLLQKFYYNKLTIVKLLSAILTVLPTPLVSYEDILKLEYKSFFNEYKIANNSYFEIKTIDYEKYKHILRASLYNEILFNNQISLILDTKGNYFSKHVSLESRQLVRNSTLKKIKIYLASSDSLEDLECFLDLINQHDVLTFLNVNIESQFGFKSIIGLAGIYIIKNQSIGLW